MSTDDYTPTHLREVAARLAGALHGGRSVEYRLGLLKRLARRLGEEAYPVFLKLLSIIAESDDDVAKTAIAEALVVALNRMDLPSGQLTSWGGSNLRSGNAETTDGSSPASSTPRRQLGPIEFLTAWYAQRTQLPQLDEKHYTQTLSLLIELCNYSPELRRLYPAKLVAESRNELEGAYTRVTRDALATIAQAWSGDATPAEIAKKVAVHESGAQAIPRGWILRDL
ncbi:MAG TPA: hypothetical protein VGC55_12815 [Dokdonella sp.]